MTEHARKLREERRARNRRGLLAEYMAAGILLAKGYRILGRRVQSPAGEIDLIACRHGRLTFVEVKRRLTQEACETSITPTQRQRIRRAAEYWLGRHPRFQRHTIAFDLIFLVPRRWPRHLPNAL